jgi:hypothetical protein
MEQFKVYEDEFLIQGKKFASLLQDFKSNQSVVSFNELEALFSQMKQTLREMTLGLDTATKKAVEPTLLEYQNKLSSFKSDIEYLRLNKDKSSLVGERSTEDRRALVSLQSK